MMNDFMRYCRELDWLREYAVHPADKQGDYFDMRKRSQVWRSKPRLVRKII